MDGGVEGRVLSEEPTMWLAGWNFQPSPLISGEERGTRKSVQLPVAKDLFNHAYGMKPP